MWKKAANLFFFIIFSKTIKTKREYVWHTKLAQNRQNIFGSCQCIYAVLDIGKVGWGFVCCVQKADYFFGWQMFI